MKEKVRKGYTAHIHAQTYKNIFISMVTRGDYKW